MGLVTSWEGVLKIRSFTTIFLVDFGARREVEIGRVRHFSTFSSLPYRVCHTTVEPKKIKKMDNEKFIR